jgi:hypothetical protein
MWTFISTMAGGGVHGEVTGIAHITMTQAGPTIKGSHPFMAEYHPVGGMITGIIAGEDINGTTSAFLSDNSRGIGATGKRAGTGRSNKPGVSRV